MEEVRFEQHKFVAMHPHLSYKLLLFILYTNNPLFISKGPGNRMRIHKHLAVAEHLGIPRNRIRQGLLGLEHAGILSDLALVPGASSFTLLPPSGIEVSL